MGLLNGRQSSEITCIDEIRENHSGNVKRQMSIVLFMNDSLFTAIRWSRAKCQICVWQKISFNRKQITNIPFDETVKRPFGVNSNDNKPTRQTGSIGGKSPSKVLFKHIFSLPNHTFPFSSNPILFDSWKSTNFIQRRWVHHQPFKHDLFRCL